MPTPYEHAVNRAARWDKFQATAVKLKTKGMTQSDIAKTINIPEPRMSQIMNGAFPTDEQLGYIIALGIREGVIDVED